MFEYKYRIKESDLDTFGHVNNAAYVRLFEECRWELITNNGYDLKYIQEVQRGPIILGIAIKYKKELAVRQNIIITCETKSYNKKIGVLAQKMIDENGDICADADISFGLFDMKTRKLITPDEKWAAAIKSWYIGVKVGY